MGWRLNPAGRSDFALSLDAARHEPAGETPEHRLGTRLTVRW